MKILLSAVAMFGIGLVIVRMPRIWEAIAWLIPALFLPIIITLGWYKVWKTKD
jgi:hypothetical protein